MPDPRRLEEMISTARAAVRSGDAGQALDLACQLLDLEPRNLDALEIRAVSETMLGEDDRAEHSLRSAIEIAPNRRWPYADLVRLLLKLGRSVDAEKVANAALAADAQNPDAHAVLGALLAEREQWSNAADHFGRAMELAGPHPVLLTGLGRSLLRQGRLDEARRLLQSAIEADPDALEANVYLAEVDERAGNFDQAMARLDRAGTIARASGTDVDLQRSVLLQRMRRPEQALALLDARADLSGAALLQRGRLRDQLGRHAEAWADWMSGKARLAATRDHRYEAGKVEAQANALASFFQSKAGEELPRAARRSDVPQPIFVIGFPRSGTTLTEQILASHSRIEAGGELPFGRELRDRAAALCGGEERFPEGLAQLRDERWPETLRDHYLAAARRLGLLDGGFAFFTDKMPVNDWWLPLLRLAFPSSPVILVRRHPLDVLTSVMGHDMTHGFHCAYRLEDAARHLALVDWLIEQYRASGVGPTIELRYETLVADQTGETERLMQAVGLEMEAAQLSFHERRTVSPTPSYAQVEEPMNSRSIERWRRHEAALGPARAILAEAVKRSGYAG